MKKIRDDLAVRYGRGYSRCSILCCVALGVWVATLAILSGTLLAVMA